MKYWVYINDKVDGPYDGDSLVTLDGFTPDTLICSEADASSGKQTWVKASTIFEFEPTEEAQEAQPAVSAGEAAMGGLAANALLEKLNTLSQELSKLQNKLDTMETNMESHINKALEDQRVQLESAFAAKSTQVTAATPAPVQGPTPAQESAIQPELAQHPAPVEESLGADPEADAAAKSITEDELVLQSALDSIHNAQELEQQQEEKDEKEDTFQDLLTPAQAKELAPAVEEPAQAPAKTSAEENQQAKDNLLDELVGPAQDDVLDQIIKEKQEEEKGGVSPVAAAALGAAAGVGIAALTSSDKEAPQETPAEENKIDLSGLEENLPEPLQIAPDKENPDHLEEVLPADQMPAGPVEDNPLPAQEIAFDAGSLPGVNEGLATAAEKEEVQLKDEVDDNENTLQELVPGAKMEPPDGVLVTEQDLREAFTERIPNMQEELVSPFSESELSSVGTEQQPSLDFSNQSVSTEGNTQQKAEDLTEIELKEGATYLISDFVPPAQATQDKEIPNELVDQQEKTSDIQDMLSSAASEEEKNKGVEEMDIASALQQTTSKRGASFDIKTVPMVQEPGQGERLQVDSLDDGVNAQHDIKPADVKSSKSAKMVLGGCVGLILLIILYALLAFMHMLPDSINFLSKPAQEQETASVAQMEEMLPAATPAAAAEESNSLDSILEEVKNYVLPNGYTLQSFIESKHPAVSPELITWDISAAVEPDNYSVLTKVPPENPQSFKMSYRFNYNAATKALDPTISDAKNLLDSATSAPAQPETL